MGEGVSFLCTAQYVGKMHGDIEPDDTECNAMPHDNWPRVRTCSAVYSL